MTARQETLTACQGQPVLVQLPLVPSYALTVHKTQALSIKHVVRGCLEGVFAMGQVYVLFSRVTDPGHLELIGLPPEDILEDICHAWERAGLDVVECLRRATTVTNEWVYSPTGEGSIRNRLKLRVIKETSVPVVLKPLEHIVNAQPRALAVIRKLLDWISRVDLASQQGLARPAFKAVNGDPIFPPEEEQWWLTDFQQRKKPEETAGDEDGPATDAEGEDKSETDDEDPTSEEDVTEQGDGPTGRTFKAALAMWHKGNA